MKKLSNNSDEIDFLIKGLSLSQQKFKNIKADQQNPKAIVIACSDSRVDPAILTSCKPGDLFIIRNVANLVPPFKNKNDNLCSSTSIALEYGVVNLKIKHIIIIGHSNCGGVATLMKQHKPHSWLNIAMEAKQQVLEQYSHKSMKEQLSGCEKKSLLLSLKNLNTYPWINDKMSKKELFLHAWYFNLKTGTVENYNAKTKEFNTIK